MIEIERLVAFLKKIHLFSGLDEDQLNTIASQFQDEVHKENEVIFEEGSQGHLFYLIFRGSAVVFQKRKKKNEEIEHKLAKLVAEDYFGEEALLTNQRRSASVRLEQESVLLTLSRDKFKALLEKIPAMKPNFEISVASRKLSRRLHFSWVHPNEVIYFLARKHIILFFQAALGPLATFLTLAAVVIIAFLFLKSFLLLWLILILGIFFGGVLLWQWIDWENDYYIVTNQRVIWLEKVVGLYDSRQESPLHSILSVSTETDQLGRVLDYGNVMIRTIVGHIPFHHVRHPYQVEALIKEHQGRSRESSRRMEVDAMKQALIKRMNPSPEPPPATPDQSTQEVKKKKTSAPGESIFGNFFKLRFEDKETITYRKHWFVLLMNVGLPSFLLFVWLLFLAAGIYFLYLTSVSIIPIVRLEQGAFWAVWLIGLIVLISWWTYQYVDWANDIYQITPDQILDIERTPLAREQRTAAQLENILATDYERYGLLGILLNYGTVHITVVGNKMTFYDLFDPINVQQDIDRRRLARNAAKEEARVAAERNRLADWFLAYNEITKEGNKPDDQNSE